MKSEFMNTVSRGFHNIGFQIQKNSPEILMGVGIITGIAGAVMACKAVTKATKIAEEAHGTIDTIKKAQENGVTNAGEEYSHEDCVKDLAITYIQTGVKYVKVYGPAIALGTVSVASILASHNIMKKRNVALAAAYAAVDKSFKEYRGRVIDRFGEEVEKELRYGVKAQQIKEEDEEGNKTEETANVAPEGVDPDTYSPYAKIFDETNPNWYKDAEQNLFYLKSVQSMANDMLRARGHMFLNEVYDMLGFQRTKAGAVVGWIYDPKNPIGDNFIDFGIMDIRREKARDFVNGYEKAIILDFNVCGSILNDFTSHQSI